MVTLHAWVRRTILALLSTALVACAKSVTPPAPAPAGSSRAPDHRQVAAITEAAEVDEIREPPQVACRLAGDAIRLERLRTSADGPTFGFVSGGPGTLFLPAAEKPEAGTAVLDDGRVIIRAVIRAEDVRLFPRPRPESARPLVLLDLVIPTSFGLLQWKSSRDATHVVVALEASDALRSPSPVEDSVACEDLGVELREFDALAGISTQKKRAKRWARSDTPLRVRIDAEPTATIAQRLELGVLEVRGNFTRVVHESPRYVVTGWVESADLTTTQPPDEGVSLPGVLGMKRLESARVHADVCSRDLSLVIETQGVRMRAGRIRAGHSFRILDRTATEAWAPIQLVEQNWLTLGHGARWIVAARDLDACQGG